MAIVRRRMGREVTQQRGGILRRALEFRKKVEHPGWIDPGGDQQTQAFSIRLRFMTAAVT